MISMVRSGWGVVWVFAVALLWHMPQLTADLLGDEDAWTCAARRLLDGAAPYACARYLYPPTFAHLAALAARAGHLHAFLVLLRVGIVLGAAALAWSAVSVTLPDRSWRVRVAWAMVLAMAAPWTVASVTFGNASALVAGVSVLAMRSAPKHPWGAGLGFGAALLLKPSGLGALPVLLAARPPWRPPVGFFVAAVGVPVLGLALTPATTWAWWQQRQTLDLTAESNVALLRALSLLTGRALPPSGVALAVIAVAAVLARMRVTGPTPLHALALTAATFALPRVWLHSLSALLPLVLLGLRDAYEGLRAHRQRPREALWSSVSLLAVAVLAQAEGLAEAPGVGSLGRGALASLPFASACWLVARLFARAPPTDARLTGS